MQSCTIVCEIRKKMHNHASSTQTLSFRTSIVINSLQKYARLRIEHASGNDIDSKNLYRPVSKIKNIKDDYLFPYNRWTKNKHNLNSCMFRKKLVRRGNVNKDLPIITVQTT